MQSKAATVEEYLEGLPPDRLAALSAVREVVLANLPNGIVEAMNWGMIAYEVPLSVVPDTYNGQPLMFAALASQKNHMAAYLMSIYMDPALAADFESRYRATGKRYDVGKSCVRFRRLEDLPLELLGEAISAMSLEEFARRYEETVGGRKGKRKATPRRKR